MFILDIVLVWFLVYFLNVIICWLWLFFSTRHKNFNMIQGNEIKTRLKNF